MNNLDLKLTFKTEKSPTHFSYSFYDNNKLNNKIYNHLCVESKKVYNLSIFCTDIFNLYKLNIYKSIYKNKKIKNGEYDDIIINKLLVYFDEYIEIKNIIKENNNYIYKYIINYINENQLILKKSNFYIIQKIIKNLLLNDININYTKNKKILFDNIIYKILYSIYTRNFNLIKNQMLNHEPYTFIDNNLINEIKENDILEAPICKNYKMAFMQLKADETYISRFIYKKLGNNTLNMQSTMIGAVIKKAYDAHSSFYESKKKSLKANKPKFLGKNELYNLIYFYSDIVIDDLNKELNLYTSNRISKNFNTIIDENYIILGNYKYIHKKYMKQIKTVKLISKKKIINKKEKKTKKDNYIINDSYIEKTNRNIIDSRYLVIPIPIKIQNKKIKTIEIIPIYGTYKIIYNYENENKEISKSIDIKLEETISIDLGINNFLTIYNPTGNQNIIKGGLLKSINYYITKK